MSLALTVIFLTALVLSAALTPMVRVLCIRSMRPGSVVPPRLGGIAIAAAATIPLAVMLLTTNTFELDPTATIKLIGISAAIVAILALGIYDDIKGASPWEKLCVQLLVALAIWMLGFRINRFSNPFGDVITLAPWASAMLTLAWVVVVTNAVNLIDGIDGLAAGVSLIAVLTLLTFGIVDSAFLVCICCVALSGALVGFLFYNFNPAAIFMGDSGSLFLGFSLAVLGIETTSKQSTAWALALPVLALGLPLFDTLFAVMRRLRNGRPVTQRDLGHVHHRLLQAGYSHRQTALFLYGVCVVLAFCAWTLKATQEPLAASIIAVVGAGVFAVIHLLGMRVRLELQRARDGALANPGSVQRRRLQLQMRELRQSGSLQDLFVLATDAASTIGAGGVQLDLNTRAPRVFSHGLRADQPCTVTVEAKVCGIKYDYGVLRLHFPDSAPKGDILGRELVVQLLADAVVDGLDNLRDASLKRELIVTRIPLR